MLVHPANHPLVEQPVDLLDQATVLADADELARRQRAMQVVVPTQEGFVPDHQAVGETHDRLEVRHE